MQRNSHCSGECCRYLHVEGQVRVEVGVQWMEGSVFRTEWTRRNVLLRATWCLQRLQSSSTHVFLFSCSVYPTGLCWEGIFSVHGVVVELYVNDFAGYVVHVPWFLGQDIEEEGEKNFFIGNCHGIVSSAQWKSGERHSLNMRELSFKEHSGRAWTRLISIKIRDKWQACVNVVMTVHIP